MNLTIKFRMAVSVTALFTVLLFAECNEKTAGNTEKSVTGQNKDTVAAKAGESLLSRKNCCDGYTGKLTDPRAEKLVKKCHFIPTELILEWTARYQKNKKRDPREKLPEIGALLGDSSSFNSCIIRKIISNEKCIGLRVIYGMSEDKKIHVIITGINPDYSTLYIKEENACCEPGLQQEGAAPPPPPTGKFGGAEYGQLP